MANTEFELILQKLRSFHMEYILLFVILIYRITVID